MASPASLASPPPAFPLPPALDRALRQAEEAVQVFSTALLQDQADLTEAAAQVLQQRAAELGQAWALARRSMPGWTPGPQVGRRLQAVRHMLAQLRAACLRRGGMAERALQTIMPAAQNATYGGRGAVGYARGQARQSGAFRLLSA